MSKNINDFIGIPGMPGLAALGVDTGIDFNYLQGNSDEEAQDNDHESNIDDEELDSEESEADQSDEKEENKEKTQKKSAGGGGKFAVPRNRGRPKKLKSKSNDGFEEDEEMNDDNEFQELESFTGLIREANQNESEKMTCEPYVPYKVPVLYRSLRGGVRYKLSEILVPRDPAVREANLQFNREYMKNKLLSLGNEASKEIKRKLKESLKSREDNQIKTIKEASMRLLLNDYLYFKSDLSQKSNERILKDMMNEIALNKLDYKNVKEVKRISEQSLQLQDQKNKKKKEHEEEEKLPHNYGRSNRANSMYGNALLDTKQQERDQDNLVKVTFCLRRENLLLTTAERAKGLNDTCIELNECCFKINNKEESINQSEDIQQDRQILMGSLNPLKNQEVLNESLKKDIINKANLDFLYPKVVVKESNPVEAESNRFLESINFCNWSIDAVTAARDTSNNALSRLNKDELNNGMIALDKSKEGPKRNEDDLFAEDSPKMKAKDSQEDDLFADESPKHKDEDIDDLFDNPKENKSNKNSEFSDDNDDAFSDSKPQNEDSFTSNKNKLEGSNGEVSKRSLEVGDLFTKNFPNPNQKTDQKKFRYFGELNDVDSIYQIRFDAKQKVNSMTFHKKKTPFDISKSKRDTAKIFDKSQGEYCRNKKLIESKIFEDISMYRFRNQKLDEHLKLGPLISNYYTKVNSKNKIEKVSLILETDNKARKDSKFVIEENMDKLYDNDIREIMYEVDAKGKKNLADRDDPEAMQTAIPDINQEEEKKQEESKQTEDNDIDDISSIDSDTKDEEKKYNVHGNLIKTNNIETKIEHARCFRFEYIDCDYDNFHKTNLSLIFDEIEQDRRNQQNNPNLTTEQKLRMSKAGSLFELQKKEEDKVLSIRIVLQSNTKLKQKLKKTGIINANDFFKDRYKLSLKSGKFLVFENIDQNPLFINNFGMASKLYRYIYSDRILPLKYFKKQPAGMGMTRHMGYYGQQILLQEDEKLPLIGQIATGRDKKYQGVTVLENNLYRVPAFYHKPKHTDFLCVIHKGKNGERLMFLREMKQIYTLGQIEPKEEVFSPQSRNYGSFIKHRVQAFALKILERYNFRVNFNELRRFFPIFNDQVLRKALKEVDVDIDRNQDAVLALNENIEDKTRNLITPENICQFESAEYGALRLQKLGICKIINPAKISYAVNKFCSEVTHQKYKKLAKIIEEEVLCTPWNLSQSFITNNQQSGMMVLKDIGDPSNGHGGYSYLKLPLKMSQDTVNKGMAIVPVKSVTGTEADLRKLSKEQIHDMLKKLGYEQTGDISTMSRWKGVKALRERSSKAASLGIISNFTKFARGVRVTSKLQKESYQKQINEIFDCQLAYLTSEKPEISCESDYEQPNKEEKALKNIAWDDIESQSCVRSNGDEENKDGKMQNDIKTQLTGYEENEIKSVYDIPGYDKEFRNKMREIYDKFNEDSHKCTVLKKVIREVDPDTKEESLRVVYIFDDRQIKNFKKRVEKLQIKKKEKPKKKDRNYFGVNKTRTEGSNLISMRLDNISEYDESVRSSSYVDNKTSHKRDYPGHGKISIPLDDIDEDMDEVFGNTERQRKGDNRDRSKSNKAKRENKSATENTQYLDGPKRQNTCSRRRQNTPLSQFNEILINIVDSCITFDNSQIFHNPVKKKDVPTYYDTIKNPMDLSTMKSKGKRCEYLTLDQFLGDLRLLKTNSEIFNGADHFITIQAVNIIERAEVLIQTDTVIFTKFIPQ